MARAFRLRIFLVACLIDIKRNPNTRSPFLDDFQNVPFLQLRNHAASLQEINCSWNAATSPPADQTLIGPYLPCQPCKCLAFLGHTLSGPFSKVHHSSHGSHKGHIHSIHMLHFCSSCLAFIFLFHLYSA